jgi:hypothetical protein
MIDVYVSFVVTMRGSQTSLSESSSEEEEGRHGPQETANVPQCEGIPRRLWSTKVVVLHNETGLPVAEGICHSVNSSLILGADGPQGDSLVAVQILKSLHVAYVPEDWRYSLRAWPIDRVYLNGASLKDHEDRDKFNHRQACLLRPLL